jgi:hypothetical protein
MSMTLARIHRHVPPLLAPIHPLLPYGLIDIVGAMRLSFVVNWMASGVFDVSKDTTRKGGRIKNLPRLRATLLQELAGIMIVVFGGETFLCEYDFA